MNATPAVPALVWIGLALLGAAGVIYRVKRAKFARWRRTSGLVVELVKEWQQENDGQSLRSASVVEFSPDGGPERTFRFQDDVWATPPAHRVGAKVEVIYNPANPHEAGIGGWRTYAPVW